jgi:ketosteroid isomerase-like protein
MATSHAVPDEVARIIQEMDREFERNVEAKDANALVAAFYAEDAQVFPAGQPVVSGLAEILQLWGGFLPILSRLALNTTRIEASGNLAYGSGTYEMTLTPPETPPIQDSGKFVVVYRRQADGSYKAVADIFNSSRSEA